MFFDSSTVRCCSSAHFYARKMGEVSFDRYFPRLHGGGLKARNTLEAEASPRCGSFFLAGVDGATNRATCLRGWCEPSVLGRSKWGKPEEFPSSYTVWMEHAEPRRNWKTFFSMKCGMPRMLCCVLACLCL